MSAVTPPAMGAPAGRARLLALFRPLLSGSDLLVPAAWVLAVLLYVATCITSPGFFSVTHTQELVSQASVLGMLAISQ